MLKAKLLKNKEDLRWLAAMDCSWLPVIPVVLCTLVLLVMPQPVSAQLAVGGGIVPPAIEDAVEDSVEEAVEEAFEEGVEETVDEAVVDAIEDRLEEDVLSVGGSIIRRIEENIESSVEDSVEESVEEVIEEKVAEAVAEDVEESVEESVEEVVEDVVESTIEDNLEQVVEGTVEDNVEEVVEENIEEEVAQNLEQGLEGSLEQEVEVQVADAVEEQMESEIDEILEGIENEFEVNEERIHRDQWLVMAEPEVFDRLAEEGYLFATITDLPGMGMRLAEVAAPSSFDISVVRQGVIDVVGKERAEVDLNHIYTAGTLGDSLSAEGITPRAAISFPDDIDNMSLRIGMIDSAVDVTHPSLNAANIHARSFVSEGATLPNLHGTAIASIIAASGTDYQGLAPKAEVYAASVFENDRQRGEIASTVSLVRALDWLMSSGVDVVNISLAGPPNRLLEAALNRASDRGVMILAAAGNGGPVADPMYPAAYSSVVAVTAVDARGQVFRLANRGEYLDLAAPGVSLLHAKAGGGYAASSGTSFAVPFAATAVARLRQLQPDSNVLDALYQSAVDLGPPGRDEIYGYGLLRPGKS
ncbi:MAG: S8 family serine peptidase [Halioglobus sp.]